jgi:hypothetical protein
MRALARRVAASEDLLRVAHIIISTPASQPQALCNAMSPLRRVGNSEQVAGDIISLKGHKA